MEGLREIRTEAIVLRSRTSGENDLVVEILTPDYGRLTGIARHGRKSQKRYGTVLECLNIVRVRFQDRERGGRVYLQDAVLQVPLARLQEDRARLMAAFYLIDIIRKSIHGSSPDPRLYLLLRESLEDLNALRQPMQVLERFEGAFLEVSGYSPVLQKCLSCSNPWVKDEKFYFVFLEGGIFCGGCLPPGLAFEPYSPGSYAALLPRFIEFQIGQPLKSRRFLTAKVE